MSIAPGPSSLGQRGVDARLASPAVGVWAGVLLGFAGAQIWAVALLGFAAGGAAGLALMVLLRRLPVDVRKPMVQRGITTVVVGLCGLLLGALISGAAADRWDTRAEDILASPQEPLLIRIASDPTQSQAPWQKDAWTVMGVASDNVRLVATFKTEQIRDVPLVRGALIEVSGSVRQAEPIRRPVLGYLNVTYAEEIRSAPRWQLVTARLKTTLAAMCDGRAGSAGPLISGMAIGDDRGLPPPVKEAMLTTSLTHLTAVSGSHIAISLAVINAIIPGRRVTRVLATWVFLVLIVAVVGPQPSVLRAVGMGALSAWGLLFNRGGQPLGILFAVTAGTLLLEPWNGVSVGFALSTVATAGIITLGRYASSQISKPASSYGALRIPRAVNEAVVIAVVAQASTLPILALINPWLPTWGVVANLLVAPIVAPLTLLGLFAALTCLWVPKLAVAAVTMATPLARYMEATALRVAGWPGAQLPWPQGVAGFFLATGSTVALLVGAHFALTGWLNHNRPN